MSNAIVANTPTRRKFLAGAAVAGAATVAMPQVSRAQTATRKMHGSWGAKDILNEFAQDYVAKVNAMGGARLKIDYLNAGAVVGAFSVQDAVHQGSLDGAHTVPAYWYGKYRAASLFAPARPMASTAASCSAGFTMAAGRRSMTNWCRRS